MLLKRHWSNFSEKFFKQKNLSTVLKCIVIFVCGHICPGPRMRPSEEPVSACDMQSISCFPMFVSKT